MDPGLQKLLGQAVVQLISGDKHKAEVLTKQAQSMRIWENHLTATIEEIINNKRRLSV